MKKLMVMMTATLAFASVAVGDVTLWVDQGSPNASDTNSGSEAEPFLTIQAAINAANEQGGGTVKVKPGYYDQGGQIDPSGLMCRADLSCGTVNLEGSGSRDEIFIVGASDPNSTDPYGRGVGAIRCAYLKDSTWKHIQGVTLLGGRTSTASDNSGCGAGVFVQTVNNGGATAYVLDCAIVDCAARSGGGTFRGSCVRTLYRHNFAAKGAAASLSAMFACVVDANYGSAALYNNWTTYCTVINNQNGGAYSDDPTLHAAALFCGNVSYDVGGNASMGDQSSATSDGVFQVASPATGDYRPYSDSKAIGLANGGQGGGGNISGMGYGSKDYLGNSIPKTGKVNAGAVQSTAERPAGAALKVTGVSFLVNGTKEVPAGSYFYPETWPVQIKAVVPSGKHLLAYDRGAEEGGRVYPQMDDSVWVYPPAGEGLTVAVTLADVAYWVDPEKGVDAEGRGTEDQPFKTLQYAVDCNAGTTKVIYAAEGDYDKGGQSFYASGWREDALVTNRVCFWKNGDIRIRGAGAGKSFISGGPDPSTGGAGAAAVRPVGIYYGTAAIQGFTLRNGYCRSGGNSADHSSAARKVDGGTLTILDSDVTGCKDSSEGVLNGVGLVRCRIQGNTSSSDLFHAGCRLESCLVYDNTLSGNVFDWSGTVSGSTLVTGSGTLIPSGHGTLTIYNSIVKHHTAVPSYVVTHDSLVNVEPLFVNAAEGDYRVRSNSPAVGTVVGNLTEKDYYAAVKPLLGGDLSGAPVPLANPVVGCYQETVAASNWYVNANRPDDEGDGLTPETAKKTLKALFEGSALLTGDTVHVAEGTYDEGVMLTDGSTVGSRVIVPTGVTLVADGAQDKTIIKGANATGSGATGMGADAVRCVSLQPGAAIRGFTLTGGRTATSGVDADKYGGGVYVPLWGDATVEDCMITNCRAWCGGGADFATLKRCRIIDNVADDNGRSTYYCRHYDCLIANAFIGNIAMLYSLRAANCTVIMPGDDQTGIYIDTGMGTCPTYNCVFVGGKNFFNAEKCAPQNCLFTARPDFLGADSRVVSAAELKFDADYRPVIGENKAIDAGDAALRADEVLTRDAYGNPRISNAVLDIGAVEADWRGTYAKDVCSSAKFKVVSADAAVVESETKSVVIPGDESLSATWKNTSPSCTTFTLKFKVCGAATLTLSVNGEEHAFAASVEEQTFVFKSASAMNELTFSCAGATAADCVELISAEHLRGTLLILR